MNLSNLLNIHANIASDVWPNGACLKCCKCRKQTKASMGECATYLRKGWPKCCGYTMELTAPTEATT